MPAPKSLLKGFARTIPADDREKSNAQSLRLPAYAQALIQSVKRVKGNPHVFAGRGDRHIAGFSGLRASLDARILALDATRLAKDG